MNNLRDVPVGGTAKVVRSTSGICPHIPSGAQSLTEICLACFCSIDTPRFLLANDQILVLTNHHLC